MMPSLRRLVPVVLLVVAACGDSREEERQDKIRAFCDQLVGKMLRDGEIELTTGSVNGLVLAEDGCRTDWEKLSENDVCTYDAATPVCLLGWNFWSNDPNACDSRGCWYACMVHVSQADLDAGTSTAEIPICATRFVDGQPFPVL